MLRVCGDERLVLPAGVVRSTGAAGNPMAQRNWTLRGAQTYAVGGLLRLSALSPDGALRSAAIRHFFCRQGEVRPR